VRVPHAKSKRPLRMSVSYRELTSLVNGLATNYTKQKKRTGSSSHSVRSAPAASNVTQNTPSYGPTDRDFAPTSKEQKHPERSGSFTKPPTGRALKRLARCRVVMLRRKYSDIPIQITSAPEFHTRCSVAELLTWGSSFIPVQRH
jgi:hypothetical protein